MSRPGIITAGIYLVVAVIVIVQDALSPQTPGAWISLRNMVPFLATFPISAPLAMLGIEPDLSNKLTVAILLLACAALIYHVTAFLAGLFTSR